jgi:hypothetical protein
MTMSAASTQITAHNARVAHIRKFVMVPPARGATLRLITCEEPPSVIGEWTREQCEDNGSTAVDVDAVLREHAQTMQTECVANLSWTDAQHQLVTSKRLKCAYEAEGVDPAFAAQAEALGITGTVQGGLMHVQTINERLVRVMLAGIHTTQQTHVAMNNTLLSTLQSSWTENRKLQAELDALRAKQRGEIDLLVDALRDSEGEPPDPEKEVKAELLQEVGSQLAKVLPHILVHLVQRAAPPTANQQAYAAAQAAQQATEADDAG